MEQRFLGATGLKVSELCLGTMTFGSETDERTAHRMLTAFVEAGGTFVDTANAYGDGASEEIIGSWMKSVSRDDLVIATKVFSRMGPGPNERGSGRKHIIAAVEASLRRLGTDYIDLYQTHVFDDATPLDETLSTLDQLVTSGKVRFLGASNCSGWQLQKALDIARANGWEPYVCLQPLYNLLDRDTEWELLPICQNEGLGLIAWSPLRMGLLSGAYRRGARAPGAGTRVERMGLLETYGNERTWRVFDTVEEVAAETGRTMAQVSLRWLLQRPGVTGPIIGARTMAQFEDNLGAAGWSLGVDELARLDLASDQPLPYPYSVLVSASRRTSAAST